MSNHEKRDNIKSKLKELSNHQRNVGDYTADFKPVFRLSNVIMTLLAFCLVLLVALALALSTVFQGNQAKPMPRYRITTNGDTLKAVIHIDTTWTYRQMSKEEKAALRKHLEKNH